MCQAGSVPRFEPFAALRYATEHGGQRRLDDVIAPPYDVLSESDVDALEARHEHNIVHVDVPRERDGPGRYDAAAQRLRSWIDDGVLVADERPSFTIYRMSFVDASGAERTIAGVLGALAVVDERGGVLPHERTTPKASTDRLDLTRATHANLSPVWGLSLAGGLSGLLDAAGEPLGAVDVDGVNHSVERLTEPARLAAISEAVASDDVLIADGHHRYGVARQFADEIRAATGRSDSPAQLTLAFVSELVEDQLNVEPIHRLYRAVDRDDLLQALRARFSLTDPAPVDDAFVAAVQANPRLCVVTGDGTAAWMQPRPGAFDELRSLDGLWLEQALADLPHEVSYQHGAAFACDAVRAGEAVAAVLTRPVTIEEITRTARQRVLMPPKSTFFTPKLRTGFVIRSLQ